MRRLIIAVLLAGCSAPQEPFDAVMTDYSAVNGATNTGWNGTKFCHPITFSGTGAHAQARQMTWGMPATGGQVGQSRTNEWPDADVHAFPDTTGWQQVPAGTMLATYECHNYADFHGSGGGQSNSLDFRLIWPPTPGPTYVSAPGTNQPITAWTGLNVCWLDSLAHMGWPGETAQVASVADGNPSGWRWQLQAFGYAALNAEARCAYLGKNFAPTGWHHASTGNPSVASIRPSEGTCFIHKVVGNLDDGSVRWRKSFLWQLEVSGGVTEADGYCVRY